MDFEPNEHAASGVTAGQARHSSSNVGGVTGQVGHNSSNNNNSIDGCSIWKYKNKLLHQVKKTISVSIHKILES